MSSGYTSEDGKTIGFEINHNMIQGHLTMSLLPPEFDVDGEQRVSIKFMTKCMQFPDQMVTTNQVTITKPYTKVMAHFFREVADKMDEWYN
jgi:hypothetical protein